MLFSHRTHAAACIFLSAASATNEAIQLNVPSAPAPGANTLSGSFQGFSLEMADFDKIAGNLSSPNKLSYQMLQNLKELTDSAAPIRIGGTTANHGFYVADQKEAIIRNFATPGADQPANLSWGPAYLESFKVFPEGTKYTVGVTFDSGKDGEDASVEEARAFYEGIGEDLYAIEVGNEFDAFPVDRGNASAYKIGQYVPEWLNRTAAIANRALGDAPRKIFQAGVFSVIFTNPCHIRTASATGPSYPTTVLRDIILIATANRGAISGDLTWTIQNAVNLGITATNRAITFCIHQYFGAACGPVKPTLAGNLMNRTALVQQMAYHADASAFSKAKGLEYVIGETNSIACQGLAGVSDTFGATMWAIDYALYAASLNVTALYWHTGIGYRYAAWQATQNGTTTPGPRPLYYGNWFIAAALGAGEREVVNIVNTTTLAGYAVYSKELAHAELRSIVLINQEIFNSSSSAAGTRSSATFRLPTGLCGRDAKTSVQRLTAAGVEVQNVTFGGRTVALDGQITGKVVKEDVVDGIVDVHASEAVLISFE